MIVESKVEPWLGLDEVSGAELSVNAYDGEGPVKGRLAKDPSGWILDPPSRVAMADLKLPGVLDLNDWQSSEVGWGVVMVEGAPVPEPVADLLSARKAQIYRYQPNTRDALTSLSNPLGGPPLDIRGSPSGMANGHLPQYLLIVGSPREVPWGIQFILASERFVGRLDLEAEGLANYVNALLNDFKAAGTADASKVVIWSSGCDGDGQEITGIMRSLLAKLLADKIAKDEHRHLSPIGVDGNGAPLDKLVESLIKERPGLVVTTSHGYAPIHDRRMLVAMMGLPVDEHGTVLTVGQSLDGWEPNGAVWYSHACCSAGCDAPTLYQGLFQARGEVDKLVRAIAGAGPMTAPLARLLLGHSKPLRAFIGHVEPTFDWTLRQPFTSATLTSRLIDAIYPNTFRYPVGRAFSEWIRSGGTAQVQHTQHKRLLNRRQATLKHLLYYQLLATDTQATVVLGDPAALLPNTDPPEGSGGSRKDGI